MVHASKTGIVLAEYAAAAAASAYGHNQPRRRHGLVSFAKRQFHIASDWACDQQHVRVTRRGDEVNAEPLDVIDRAVQTNNFNFTSVARTGVHFADVE